MGKATYGRLWARIWIQPPLGYLLFELVLHTSWVCVQAALPTGPIFSDSSSLVVLAPKHAAHVSGLGNQLAAATSASRASCDWHW